MERKTLITMMMIELTTLVSKRSSLKMKIRTRKRMILRTLSILMLSFFYVKEDELQGTGDSNHKEDFANDSLCI